MIQKHFSYIKVVFIIGALLSGAASYSSFWKKGHPRSKHLRKISRTLVTTHTNQQQYEHERAIGLARYVANNKRQREQRQEAYNRQKTTGNRCFYFMSLVAGLYALNDTTHSMKKLQTESEVDKLLDTECGQQYIEAMADRLQPYIMREILSKGNIETLDHMILQKTVINVVKDKTGFIPPKDLVDVSLDNDVVKTFEKNSTDMVLHPLLLVAVEKEAKRQAVKCARLFYKSMLFDSDIHVPELVIREFAPEMIQLREAIANTGYLSALIITPVTTDILKNSVLKRGTIRTFCLGLPAITIPTACFLGYENRDELCKKSQKVLFKINDFLQAHEKEFAELMKIVHRASLISNDHLDITGDMQASKVLSDLWTNNLTTISQSSVKKVGKVVEPVSIGANYHPQKVKTLLSEDKKMLALKESKKD